MEPERDASFAEQLPAGWRGKTGRHDKHVRHVTLDLIS